MITETIFFLEDLVNIRSRRHKRHTAKRHKNFLPGVPDRARCCSLRHQRRRVVTSFCLLCFGSVLHFFSRFPVYSLISIYSPIYLFSFLFIYSMDFFFSGRCYGISVGRLLFLIKTNDLKSLNISSFGSYCIIIIFSYFIYVTHAILLFLLLM